MHINFRKTRQVFVFFLTISVFALLLARLVYIQILRNKELIKLADRQHGMFVKLPPRRGNIYDRFRRVLAVYLDTPSIYAVPKEIADKEIVSGILSSELKLDNEELLAKLEKDNYFAWVARKVKRDTANDIKDLGINGIYTIKEPKRFYPGGMLACHVLGLTGIDNEGLEGIELYCERELKGEYGWRRSTRDAKRREVVSLEKAALPARNGRSVVLTIDQVIQHAIESEIEKLAKSYKPKAVSVIAANPVTGEILGLANYPAFDPNDTSGIKTDFVRNRAIADSFEPGSVFKLVTASAALEEGIVDFDTGFFCENGSYRVGKRTLHDYHAYGKLTFREVIEKSSNIGTAKVAGLLGREKLAAYIKKFNFSGPTGIDLPGEAGGIMRDPSGWSYVDMTTVPMGQGIAVTALQLAAAISAIANEGVLMKPYVVKEVLSDDGRPARVNKPSPVRKVVSKQTADKVKEILKGAVERGTGRRAKIARYTAAGKTGTAQKVNPDGGYYKNKYIASFIGFAPCEKPLIALVISVDEPRGRHFGGQVAAPAFKNIMEKILPYMETAGYRNEA